MGGRVRADYTRSLSENEAEQFGPRGSVEGVDQRPGMLFHAATTLSLTCHLLATVDYADRAVPLRQFLDRAAMLNAISREMSKYLAGLSFTSRFR